MKAFFFIISIFFGFFAVAQRDYVYGVVQDSSLAPLYGAHIQNLDAGRFTISNENGKFKIPVKPGDTLSFTFVGYQSKLITVENFDFLTIQMVQKIINLEEISVTPLPSYRRFKDLVLETDGSDTTYTIELPKVEMQYRGVTAQQLIDPNLAPRAGVPFDMGNLTKKEKEKRKLKKIISRQEMERIAHRKFNRQWISEQTKLEGDDLTDFIAYCKFSIEYLTETSLFEIHIKMMALLKEFKNDQKENKNHRYTPSA